MRKLFLLTMCIVICLGNLQAQNSEILTWYTTGKEYQTKNDLKNAIKSYARAIELCPNKLNNNDEAGKNCINCYFNIGICAQDMEKFKVAEEQYSIVIKNLATDHEAYARRAACRTELGKKRKALSDLEKAVSIVSNDWHQLDNSIKYWYVHDLALAYRNVNKLKEAIAYIDKAIAIKDGADIRIEKAKILLRMGKTEAVKKELDVIKNLGATENQYGYIKGMVYLLEKDYSKAISYLDSVVEGEDYKDAQRHLTLCHIEMNYMDAARRHLQSLKDNNYNPAELAWLESQLATKEGRWDEALNFADHAESIHTEYDTLLHLVRLQRARIHYRQGDFQDVLGECDLVLSELPMHLEASTLKGLSYLEIGQRAKAGDILLAMAQYYPNDPLVESRLGWYQYRNGNKQQAADKLLNLVGLHPNNAEIRYYYAEVCYQMEIYDPSECSASLDVAIGLDPSMEEAYALKARILHENSNMGEAMMFLNKAEELGLIHTYASANAAKIYMENGEYEKALEKAANALRDADDINSQRIYGSALGHSGNWSEAIKHFDYCLQLDPSDWQSLKFRAFALTEVGENRRAIQDFDKAIALSPNDPELYNARGRAYSIFGKYDKAVTDFDMAIRININYTDAYYQKGRMYLDKRDYGNASFSLEQALSVSTYDNTFTEKGMLYNDLGLAKAELDDPYGALGYYNKGIELDPNDLLFENRARLHADLGNNDLAMEDYQKAINLNGKDPVRYYELGKIQKITEKFWEASSSFTFAIQNKMSSRQEVPLDYYRKRGECYFAMGGEYLTAAEGDFLYLKDKDTHNWQPLYYLGKCKYQKGDYTRAIKYFTSSLEIDNQHEEVYIARGDAFSMIEAFGKAVVDYGSAITLNPKEMCYYKKKGHANLRNEVWIEAVKDYDSAIALAHRQGLSVDAELYHGKGRAYTGKAYAEGNDNTYKLAIDNYHNALYAEGVTEREKYFIKLNMMTTYEKWGNVDMMNEIRNQLPKIESYQEPAVMSCS